MSDGKAENTMHDNAIGWFILLAVMLVLAWVFWHYFDTQIRDMVRWIRYGEMKILSFFLPQDYTVAFKGQDASWWQGYRDTPEFKDEALTFSHLSYFNALAMQPLKMVFAFMLGCGALWAMFYGPNTQYRTTLGLEGLIARQSKNFPVIAPFVKFNPSTQPPRAPGSPVPAELPSFAEALGPEEWLAYYNIPVPDGKIDEGAANRAFQRQLIARWKGIKALSPERQILLAAFALKAARKRGEADDMLGRLAQCWTFQKGLNLKKDATLLKDARKVLANKDIAGGTIARANRHAFVTTAMLGALEHARNEGGVLAPAQFVWLRGHDRTLWYPLNNLGRKSFHIEATGAMSHYRAEKMTQRPIPVPKMEDAVETIIEYMKSSRARPIPPLDYSHSKTKAIKKAE